MFEADAARLRAAFLGNHDHSSDTLLKSFSGRLLLAKKTIQRSLVLINPLSVQFMKESKFVPARLEDNGLTVIMSNPLDYYVLDAIRVATRYNIRALAGRESQILETIERYYGLGTTPMERIIEDMESLTEYRIDEEESVDHLLDTASEGPVIRLVNLVISRAIEARESDIHLNPLKTSSGLVIGLTVCSTMWSLPQKGFRRQSSHTSRSRGISVGQ